LASGEQPVRLVVGRPIAALVIAAVAVREGRDAWRGDSCCAAVTTAPAEATQPDACGCCPTPH